MNARAMTRTREAPVASGEPVRGSLLQRRAQNVMPGADVHPAGSALHQGADIGRRQDFSMVRVHGVVRPGQLRLDPFEQEAAERSHGSASRSIAAVDPGHLARQGPEIVPALRNPMSVGRALEPHVRVQMENRLGFGFAGVRIHDDASAAQANTRMDSNAYTMGSHIAFAEGRYQPQSAAGRELLAHELTHVVQQRAHRSVQMQKRGAAKDDQVLTTNWDVQFQLNRPSPAEMNADPATVLTASGLSSLKLVTSAFQANPGLEVELEGNASIEGPPEFNTQLSINRARYLARLVGVGRVSNVPGRKHECPQIGDGLYGCGTMHAHPAMDPTDRRVNLSMFTPSTEVGRPRVPFGGGPTPQPGPDDTKKPDKPDDDKKPDKQDDKKAQTPTSSTQWTGGASRGFVAHHYLSPHGASDPAHEAVFQLIGAYTRQRHREGEKGLELGVPVQLQVSRETGVVSIAGGGQLTYVIPFGKDNKWQWGAFAQVLLGQAVDPRSGGSTSTQLQPSVGTQIMFQPKKWLQLGAQGTFGGTVQTNGPSSLDYGGAVIIQFVH